jgi:hypothetical protein
MIIERNTLRVIGVEPDPSLDRNVLFILLDMGLHVPRHVAVSSSLM